MAKKYIVVEVDTDTGVVGAWNVYARDGEKFISEKSNFYLCGGYGECIRIPKNVDATNFDAFDISEALIVYANHENMARKESVKWEVCE